jgi:hypothetical protein
MARFRPHKPDGGSYPYYYALDQLGLDVVCAQQGEPPPRRDQARKRLWALTNRANLVHLQAVNGFFTDLAGHARTHPGSALQRWWPAGRCQQMGAFAEDGDDVQIRVHRAKVRPDGHGIWREADLEVPFFVEIDLHTEPLWKLVDKLDGYAALAHATGRVWPVLFWLTSPLRERHLHHQLSEAGIVYPVATGVRDDPARAGLSPAEQVWWQHRRAGGLRRLADLADTVTDVRDRAA